MNEVDVCRAVLIEVLTILAKDLDKLAVVGCWVPELAADETHHRLQELVVWKACGVDLAFTFQQDVFVEGTRLNGGHNKVTAKMPIIAAWLCIKAITLSERKKEKDACGICFCIESYQGGYKKLTEEFRGTTNDKLIAEGIGILREKVEKLDSIGPVWAAQTVEEATAGTGFDIEMEQRRACEIVNALLREIDSMAGE